MSKPASVRRSINQPANGLGVLMKPIDRERQGFKLAAQDRSLTAA
jgi:hypothetical protein